MAILLLLTVLIGACAGGETTEPTDNAGSYGSGIDLDVGPDGEPQAQDPASQPDTGNDAQAPQPQDPEAPASQQNGTSPGDGDDASEPNLQQRPRDDLDTGYNAVFYLRPDQPKLAIELNGVNGRIPSSDALNTLRSKLGGVLDKPGGIQILSPQTFTSTQNVYSLDDVKRLERVHRTRHSEGDTVVMHYLFLNGRFENEGVLGIAYGSSSIVIFSDQVQNASTPLVPPEAIMRSVLVHEAGHLLRLVNNGYESPRNHEDPEHPGHTRHEDGVMFWAVESLSVASVLQGGPPVDFHPDSLADLEDLKAGRVG